MIGRLFFESNLEIFLCSNNYDKIAMLLYNGNSSIINEIGNYFRKEDGDSVSYVPKSRYDTIDSNNPFNSGSGRVTIRVGRLVTKFIKKSVYETYNIVPKDVETFVNLYKSCFNRESTKLEIVEGKDIQKWYLETNYYHSNGNRYGTLWNSCMRQPERNKFMKMYTENPDNKMLVLLTNDGKLLGRALLWDKVYDNLDNEYKFMDRVYTVYDHDINIFKDWARDNGYVHKMEQNARTERYIVSYNSDGKRDARSLELYVKIENHQQKYYPYLDTFKFYDSRYGTFSNNDDSRYEYILVQSNGGLFPPEPEPIVDDDWEEEFVEDDE